MKRLTQDDFKALYECKLRGLSCEQTADKTKLHPKTVYIYTRQDYADWLKAKALGEVPPLSPRQQCRDKSKPQFEQGSRPFQSRKRKPMAPKIATVSTALFELLTADDQAIIRKHMLKMLLSYA